jgi:hypothetical protein
LADGIFGVDDAIMGVIECYLWKFWRRLWALTEQLPWAVALVGGFEVRIGESALSASVVELLGLTGVFTQDFKTVVVVHFSGKNENCHTKNLAVTL